MGAKIYIAINTHSNRIKNLGKNNTTVTKGSILTKNNIEILGDNNQLILEEDCRLVKTSILIKGNNHKVYIKSRCYFGAGCSTYIDDNNCEVILGSGCRFKQVRITASEGKSIRIGNKCMFSYNIGLRCSDNHSIIDTVTGERINPARNIEIGDHVWVAPHSEILKGVRIGSNCVIGTGSIVTRDLPKNSVAVGVPARVTRSNVTWTHEKI